MNEVNVQQLSETQKIDLVAAHVQTRIDDADQGPPQAKELAALMVHAYATVNTGNPLGLTMLDRATGRNAVWEITANTPMWTVKTPGDPNASYIQDATLPGWEEVYRPTVSSGTVSTASPVKTPRKRATKNAVQR